MAQRVNKEFELRGINHLALVCKDMARTVDFYTNVLGMPLTKTIDLPGGRGQHFFFDIGNGDSLAFFWFPDGPEAAPGIASPGAQGGKGSLTTAHGSMTHVAFDGPLEVRDEHRAQLVAKRVEVAELVNHDDTPKMVSATVNASRVVRSIDFVIRDGIMLEFASSTRELGNEGEVSHKPATAA